MKVICNNLKCKHWKQSGVCSCQTIILKYSNIATVNQGRKDILECSRYEESTEYANLIKKVDNLNKAIENAWLEIHKRGLLKFSKGSDSND